jgi:hypothetical protein
MDERGSLKVIYNITSVLLLNYLIYDWRINFKIFSKFALGAFPVVFYLRARSLEMLLHHEDPNRTHKYN